MTRFLYSFPFHRCHVKVWFERMDQVDPTIGQDNQWRIKIKEFGRLFKTSAWWGSFKEGKGNVWRFLTNNCEQDTIS